MITMTQTEYNSIVNEPLEQLRKETPKTKAKLDYLEIESGA